MPQTSLAISRRSSKLCMDNSSALSMPTALATSHTLALICSLAVNSIAVCDSEPSDGCKGNPKAMERQRESVPIGLG